MTEKDASFTTYDAWYKDGYTSLNDNMVKLGATLEDHSTYNFTKEKSRLSDFSGKAFMVGGIDAFQNISKELCDKIDKVDKKVNDYISLAEERKQKILDCMAIDDAARAAADQAYTDYINNNRAAYEKTVYVKDLRGVIVGSYVHCDEVSLINDAEAEREAVWVDKRCDLWD